MAGGASGFGDSEFKNADFLEKQSKSLQIPSFLGNSLDIGEASVISKAEYNARPLAIPGYSARADQRRLVDWVAAMFQPPGEIRLVHGEDGARWALGKALSRAWGQASLIVVIEG